jgi:hypothetical protein
LLYSRSYSTLHSWKVFLKWTFSPPLPETNYYKSNSNLGGAALYLLLNGDGREGRCGTVHLCISDRSNINTSPVGEDFLGGRFPVTPHCPQCSSTTQHHRFSLHDCSDTLANTNNHTALFGKYSNTSNISLIINIISMHWIHNVRCEQHHVDLLMRLEEREATVWSKLPACKL